MHLSQARRIVLLNYNSATRTIDWRHYIISVRPVGISKSVRRVIEGTNKAASSSSQDPTSTKRKGKSLVNLGSASDISEYVLGRASRAGSVSSSGFDTDASDAESDMEDAQDERNKVNLPQSYLGRGNQAESQRAVKLREIGPRMELRLVKVEEGIGGGEVLYHETGELRVVSLSFNPTFLSSFFSINY